LIAKLVGQYISVYGTVVSSVDIPWAQWIYCTIKQWLYHNLWTV